MPAIKASTNNATDYFNLDGLDYEKGVYTLYYDSVEKNSSGVINESKIRVGLGSKNEVVRILQGPSLVTDWTDGTTPYSDFDTFITAVTVLIGGGGESIVLGFFGQSNMDCVMNLGTTGGDKELNTDVTVWDSILSRWVIADTNKFPFGERDAFFNNVQTGTTTGNNNVAFHTAKRIQEKTGKKVRIIYLAHSGQSIDRWIATDGNPSSWTTITALLTATGVSKLDGVFFYQGESDATDTGGVYAPKVETLRQQFRDIDIVDRESSFIMAEMGPFYNNLNGNFFDYPEYLSYIDDNYFAVVEAEDLVYWDTNNAHLDPDSIVTISDRFSSTFLSLPKNNEEIVTGKHSQRVASLWEEQTSGTNGGSSVIGFQTRTLNTYIDPSGIISNFTANQFILRAGTYKVNGFTSVVASNESAGYLKNITDGTMAVLGGTAWSYSVSIIPRSAIIAGIFTITAAKVFEVQLYCATAKATNGLGVATSSGEKEIFTYLEITKL